MPSPDGQWFGLFFKHLTGTRENYNSYDAKKKEIVMKLPFQMPLVPNLIGPYLKPIGRVCSLYKYLSHLTQPPIRIDDKTIRFSRKWKRNYSDLCCPNLCVKIQCFLAFSATFVNKTDVLVTVIFHRIQCLRFVLFRHLKFNAHRQALNKQLALCSMFIAIATYSRGCWPFFLPRKSLSHPITRWAAIMLHRWNFLSWALTLVNIPRRQWFPEKFTKNPEIIYYSQFLVMFACIVLRRQIPQPLWSLDFHLRPPSRCPR